MATAIITKAAGIKKVASKTRPTEPLSWSIPRWHTAHELRKVCSRTFGLNSIFRMISISLAIFAALCIWAKIAYPELHFEFLWMALLAIPGLFAYLAANMLLLYLAPGNIRITDEKIIRASLCTGPAWHYKLEQIESSKLFIFSADFIYLYIRLNNIATHSQNRIKKIAIPSETNLREITARLPKTIVFDKRSEFQKTQELVAA